MLAHRGLAGLARNLLFSIPPLALKGFGRQRRSYSFRFFAACRTLVSLRRRLRANMQARACVCVCAECGVHSCTCVRAHARMCLCARLPRGRLLITQAVEQLPGRACLQRLGVLRPGILIFASSKRGDLNWALQQQVYNEPINIFAKEATPRATSRIRPRRL